MREEETLHLDALVILCDGPLLGNSCDERVADVKDAVDEEDDTRHLMPTTAPSVPGLYCKALASALIIPHDTQAEHEMHVTALARLCSTPGLSPAAAWNGLRICCAMTVAIQLEVWVANHLIGLQRATIASSAVSTAK